MNGGLCFLSTNSGWERRRNSSLGSENNKTSQILMKSNQHVADGKHRVEVEMDDRKETKRTLQTSIEYFSSG